MPDDCTHCQLLVSTQTSDVANTSAIETQKTPSWVPVFFKWAAARYELAPLPPAASLTCAAILPPVSRSVATLRAQRILSLT
ncbi:MAG: hypothetical protein V3V20_03990 [Algisphaera sp.]